MIGFQSGFTQQEKSGVRYLTIPSFEKAGGAVCAFSTRVGGVSPAPFDTLNFSRKREKNEANFQENMRRFAVAAGFDVNSAISIRYAHGSDLYRAEMKDAGLGIVRESLPDSCDGLFTDTCGLPIISFHADCVPLFYYDPIRRAAAVCHAGWRGTSQHIAKKAVESLLSLGCRPENILAAVGPAISVTNYQVGADVADIFLNEFGKDTVRQIDGHWYVDLPLACAIDMTALGIKPESITMSDLCTFDREDLFYSHRRDHGNTGAMAAVIELLNN